jgi:hypothetical protein
MFAMLLLVLIGFVALSIDGGYIMAERRQTQNAADAAALAAAKAAQDGLTSGVVNAAAQSYGALNAGDNSTTTMNWPPATGAYAGNAEYIQVTVTKQVRRFFIGAVYNGPWEVSATAVAGLEPEGFNAALLALNSDAGGIDTSGNTHIRVIDGSIVSNYNIDTSGNTSLRADEYVTANDGFRTSGNTVIDGGKGEKPNAPEIPDPLLNRISPPNLPSFPNNPVNSVNPGSRSCGTFSSGSVPSGTYAGGANCVSIQNVTSNLSFATGNFRFNGAGIDAGGNNSGRIVIGGGTYNFVGGSGIAVGGNTPNFEILYGSYSFTNGAGIDIGGNAPGIVIGGGTYYFTGGGGIKTNGNNQVTLNPGTYIFDGGSGISMSGNDRLVLNPGAYEFWFGRGADMSFQGNSRITHGGNVYTESYYYGTSGNMSDLAMSGNSNFSVPAGEYYFDRGRFLNSGNSLITGTEVFFYFKNGGYLESSGNASFGFTAPTTQIYPGYCCKVFLYSDRANTARFQWFGNSASATAGTIYLPSSPIVLGGNSAGQVFAGQYIADRFLTSGNTQLTVQFVENVQTQIPRVYLVE